VDRVSELDTDSAELVDRLVRVAGTGLPGMQTAAGLVCTTRRFSAAGVVAEPEGWSLRGTAITVLGVRHLDEGGQRRVLGGRTVAEVCGILVDRLPSTNSPGDAALAVWAAAACGHDGVGEALRRLDVLDAGLGGRLVVDLAWTVSALVAAREVADVERRLDHARTRLLGSRTGTGDLFGHVAGPDLVTRYRRHVASFADQAYAIQALARLHASGGDATALAAADRCARRVSARQGPAGQWWWHWDVRTGEVIEGYPVHSAHQYALAPMALLDLADAGGEAYPEEIRRGLSWLVAAPEVDEPLVLDGPGLIAHGVHRGDPGKLVRGARTLGSAVSPTLRLRTLDRIWPPTTVDRECRPWALGWLLDCWLTPQRTGRPAPTALPGRSG
jgi:hypothetical protein